MFEVAAAARRQGAQHGCDPWAPGAPRTARRARVPVLPRLLQPRAGHDEPNPVRQPAPRGVRQPRRVDAAADRARGRRATNSCAGAFPRQPGRLGGDIRFALAFATHLGIPVADQVHFVAAAQRPAVGVSRSAASAVREPELVGVLGAEHRSPGFQKFLADGLTRSLVAARAREMSARTGGYILLQLLQDLASPGPGRPRAQRPDQRRLDRPVADRAAAARRRLPARLPRGRRSRAKARASPACGSSPSTMRRARRRAFDDTADYYVAAVPVEVLREAHRDGRAQAASPALAGLDQLQVAG